MRLASINSQQTGKLRNYSKVLSKVDEGVKHLNSSGVSAVVHLGDIIDGQERLEQTHKELDTVLEHLSRLQSPLYHVIGNHCMMADSRYLLQKLNLTRGTYYFRDLAPQWRLIVLDTVEVSLRSTWHKHVSMAKHYLATHQGEPSAQEWNGTIGPEQMVWLENQLRDSEREGRTAIVCGHLPIMAEASGPEHVMWHNDKLLDLFRTYSGTVKAYFSGHYHPGGYAKKDDVHHVTLEAILDSDKEEGASAVLELHDSWISIDGIGSLTTRRLSTHW